MINDNQFDWYTTYYRHAAVQRNPLISNSDYRDFWILATFSLCKFTQIIEIPLKEIFG